MKAILLYWVLTWSAVLSADLIATSLVAHTAFDSAILFAACVLFSCHGRRWRRKAWMQGAEQGAYAGFKEGRQSHLDTSRHAEATNRNGVGQRVDAR